MAKVKHRSGFTLKQRAAQYIGLFLAAKGKNIEPYNSRKTPPSEPAVLFYDVATDELVWLACEAVTMLEDYASAFPDNINEAARQCIRLGPKWKLEQFNDRQMEETCRRPKSPPKNS